jgi:hypothetical protein
MSRELFGIEERADGKECYYLIKIIVELAMEVSLGIGVSGLTRAFSNTSPSSTNTETPSRTSPPRTSLKHLLNI